MKQWENFTTNNIPPHRIPIQLIYKGVLWTGERLIDNVYGVSPMGEIKLATTVVRIIEHDRENNDQTLWRVL